MADEAAYAPIAQELAAVLDRWIEETDDFPAWVRVRDDNTDRMTGVKFTNKIPPMRHPEIPAGSTEVPDGTQRE